MVTRDTQNAPNIIRVIITKVRWVRTLAHMGQMRDAY